MDTAYAVVRVVLSRLGFSPHMTAQIASLFLQQRQVHPHLSLNKSTGMSKLTCALVPGEHGSSNMTIHELTKPCMLRTPRLQFDNSVHCCMYHC